MPAPPRGSALDLKLADTFSPDDAAAPQPGDLVRYRVRTIDAIGRPSATYTETDPVRLEKRQPPPVPIEVDVRVLVRDAPDLTADEASQLGNHTTMTILRWAWRDEQRAQDPLRHRVPGLQRATDGHRDRHGACASPRSAPAASRRIRSTCSSIGKCRPTSPPGLRLDAGHPFLIVSHTAGTTITMLVETRLRFRRPTPEPELGPIRLQLPLTPDRSRPPAWGPRVTVVPITAATEYRGRPARPTDVTADEPYDALWVGVSSADAQAYIADQLAPIETRPGNESAIVAMQATARYAGRPELEIPPPLAAVPQLRTPEPGAEPMHFPLDLTRLPPGTRIRHAFGPNAFRPARCWPPAPSRPTTGCSPRRSIRAPRATPTPRSPSETPADRTELVAALRSGRSTEVDDRFLVYLAGHHRYRDRLFAPSTTDPSAAGPFAETLPPNPDRWIYRVRGVDAAGHVSAGSATARVVVRVPSLQAGAPPVKLPRAARRCPRTAPGADSRRPQPHPPAVVRAPSVGIGPVEVSEVIRVPNRPDLLPDGGL